MTIDELLFKLTARGYIKCDDLWPPDEYGQCRCHRPERGTPFWRTRALWQMKIDNLDFISVYPCSPNDVEGDTFVFILFNPRNGVIDEWRIGEHWTGEDFLIEGCRSLEMALFTHQNWLAHLTAEHD